MLWRTVPNTAKGMPAHWLTPCSLSLRGPALHVLYMCDLALPRVLHIIMLFWEEGGASWVDGSPLQQHTDAATRSMKTKFQQVIKVFSFNLLQQFSIVGPLILLVIHLSSLSKALCLHFPRSNATANSLFHISVRHTSSCKPAAEMSTRGLKWCCTDMKPLYINLLRPNGL